VVTGNIDPLNLYLQVSGQTAATAQTILVVGEILWDLFPGSIRLGGAALNFAVHAKRLRHHPLLLSALGRDELGQDAVQAIRALGLDTTFIQNTDRFKTGTASVQLGPNDHTAFVIERPAAYDALEPSAEELQQIATRRPGWLYYGTLFPSRAAGKQVLDRVLQALPDTRRFYDVNLRPGCDSPELLMDLLRAADVVKLNEEELRRIHRITGLPADGEGFCRAGARRYEWSAVCVTLGARGCAMLIADDYVEAEGHPVKVADTVGAGDAFAAAVMHGLSSGWPAAEIADFSNRVGAFVASVHGAIPDWTLKEA
jgi:fructokinase